MKKYKILWILSLIFTILAGLVFIYCLYFGFSFIGEISKPPEECVSNPCFQIQPEPIIFVLFILGLPFAAICSIPAIVFSMISKKHHKSSKILLLINVVMLILEIILLIIMIILI